MTVYSVCYRCQLHNDPKTYTVEIPWPEESHPTAEQVWDIIKTDPALLAKLFGEDFTDYADMAARPEHYESLLERTRQTATLVIDFYPPEEPEESFAHKCSRLLHLPKSQAKQPPTPAVLLGKLRPGH